MSHRFTRSVFGVLAVLALCSGFAIVQAADARPNILFIYVEDLGNLIDDPAHAGALARLRGEFTGWRSVTRDPDLHPSEIARRTQPAKR